MKRWFFVLAFVMACESPKVDSIPVEVAPTPTPAATNRIVAMGDVHGDVSAMKSALRAAGILGPDDSRAAGSTILVQTGDLLDRGDDEREVVDLMVALKAQAAKAGGRVIQLNGNHELMNAMGDLRYVTPKAMPAFDDAATDEDLARYADAPAEIRGRLAAWGPKGPYARRFAADGVIAIVDGNVFAHGGVLPKHAAQLENINQRVRQWLNNGGEPPQDVVADPESPVWTRLYSQNEPTPEACQVLAKTLSLLGAKRMFVGHTPQVERGANSACDGKIWRIDVGMSAHYGGKPQVVVIEGDRVSPLP